MKQGQVNQHHVQKARTPTRREAPYAATVPPDSIVHRTLPIPSRVRLDIGARLNLWMALPTRVRVELITTWQNVRRRLSVCHVLQGENESYVRDHDRWTCHSWNQKHRGRRPRRFRFIDAEFRGHYATLTLINYESPIVRCVALSQVVIHENEWRV